MADIKDYVDGQPIEPIGRRLHIGEEGYKELEAYRDIGTIPQIRMLVEKYHTLLEQYNELLRADAKIRVKAIEEFVEQIKARAYFKEQNESSDDCVIAIWKSELDEIAKELKGE